MSAPVASTLALITWKDKITGIIFALGLLIAKFRDENFIRKTPNEFDHLFFIKEIPI